MTPSRRRLTIGLIALAAFALVISAIEIQRLREASAAARAEGVALHRLVSQRVDQHDAHLTSLSALAQAANPPPIEEIRQVVASIIRFYPRIVDIDVVDLARGGPSSLLGTSTPLSAVAEAVTASNAMLKLLPVEGERLLLVKRVPTEGPLRGAIALTVDLRKLVATDAEAVSASSVQLFLDGRPLLATPPPGRDQRVVFDATLASRSQPLRLQLIGPGLSPSLPPWPVLLLAGLPIALAAYGLERLLDARRSAREAAARALLASQDAKLAHASRVNAMGELASGIAHELTQPLTAILSHSQAGLRIASRPELDKAAIATAFEATTRNAKRAGEILGKLRSWVSKGQPTIQEVQLSGVIGDVVQLLAGEAAEAGIDLKVAAMPSGAVVLADRVHMEQVVFNLVRNAIEALRANSGQRAITVSLSADADAARIEVRDTGSGFSQEALGRLFEPFFTTRPEGMGLGLSLCTTLVERYEGTLTASNAPDGGAVMRLQMPLSSASRSRPQPEAAE